MYDYVQFIGDLLLEDYSDSLKHSSDRSKKIRRERLKRLLKARAAKRKDRKRSRGLEKDLLGKDI